MKFSFSIQRAIASLSLGFQINGLAKKPKQLTFICKIFSESTKIRTEIEQDSADLIDYFWQFYTKNWWYVFCSFLCRWVSLYTVQLFTKYILNNYSSSVLQNKIKSFFSEVYLETCQTSTSSPYYHQKLHRG